MMRERYALARGMRDLLPVEAARMSLVETSFIDELRKHGYEEIRLPLVERTELFHRGVGESTDVVSKEMYTMEDRSGESLSLRPEGTASCVRAAIDGNMLRGASPRLWYSGTMYRYERPQKGRYREFTQIGAEAFGYVGPDVDVELMTLCSAVWQKLGIADHVVLEINTLGSFASRVKFRDALVDDLEPQIDSLDPDSVVRLKTNPLRILDSKNDRTQEILNRGPMISDCLDDESLEYFGELRHRLDALGIAYQINDRLVRGLDYYTHTVFEWNTDLLGAQRQLGGGGRYDGLFELLGGESTKAAGFAVGIDRIALVHEKLEQPVRTSAADIYLVCPGGDVEYQVNKIASILRNQTQWRVKQHFGGGRLKVQLRSADRSGARWALIAGEDEIRNNAVSVKWLRESREQESVSLGSIADFFERQAE